MRTTLIALALLLAACGGTPLPQAPVPAPAPVEASSDAGPAVAPADGGSSADSAPTLGGCPMFPASNEWNRDVSGDPVDARSADYLAFMGSSSLMLHPD